MLWIGLKGIILAVVVNAPLILYLIWSWRLLNRHSASIRGNRAWLRRADVWLRLLLASTIVSVIWPLVALILGILYPLLAYTAYNPDGNREERAFAQFFLGFAYLPYTIAFWIGKLLPTYVSAFLIWVLVASFIVLLLTASVLQWLFIIIRSHLVDPKLMKPSPSEGDSPTLK